MTSRRSLVFVFLSAVMLLGLALAGGALRAQPAQDSIAPPNGLSGSTGYPETHIEAPGQGAQDPARSEFLEGWSRDMPRCLNTLLARRESRQEAQEVCEKILTDLGD